MGLFEWRLKQKVKREMKAEQKQAQIDEGLAAAKRRTDNNITKLESFGANLEEQIKKYRAKAKEAQRNNNKAVFHSCVAQILTMQKMLDNNTLMMVDAIRHADSQQVNREMMAAQATIGELVNPKLDISEKDMLATREKFQDNALNLSSALERDEQFAAMFDDMYTGVDSEAESGLFDSLASELISEVAHEEAAHMDFEEFGTAASSTDLAGIKDSIRREREALAALRRK